MKLLAVHNGNFHADDIFATAILKLIYPEIKLIRTRDPEKFKRADFRIDVGRKYNSETSDYDHHQKEFNEKRKNGIPYASAGLIWKHFGKRLVNSQESFQYIDEKIIQTIDAEDNGIKSFSSDIVPYTLGNVIHSFSPSWKIKNSDEDKFFEEAVFFAVGLLKREIDFANNIGEADKIIEDLISKSDGNYIIVDPFVPWKKTAIEKSNLKFVIEKESNGWVALAVPIEENSFERRKSFPKKWAGLSDEKLVKITRVKDATFCHKDLFVAGAKSKEGVIKLIELTLKEK